MDPDASPLVARHRRAGGRACVLRRGRLVEWDGADEHAAARRRGPAGRARRPRAATTSPTRSRRPAGRGRMGATREQVADGPARLPPVGGPVAGPAQPVPAGSADGHRGLRPQRGRHGGDPRRRGGDRRRGGGTGRPGDGDHRHRRRPAGRHAARDRADRRAAGAAGGDQGDARLPARARPRGDRPGHRRRAGRGRPGPGDDPRLRERGRGPGGGAGRCGQLVADGRADAPRVIVLFCHEERDAVFALLERLGARGVDVATEMGALAPRLADRNRPGA